jgi:GAF domain-containing protein
MLRNLVRKLITTGRSAKHERERSGAPDGGDRPSARSPEILARALHVKNAIFRIEDTGRDERWPRFSAEAARLNVRSMLCVPLWIDERGLGALSLYADQAAAFSDPHERVTVLLATFAALALAEAQRADQLHDALGNRDVIGQAKGILMERHGVTADAAFGVLSRVSQAENLKLAEIARQFVATGKLPGGPGPEAAEAMP